MVSRRLIRLLLSAFIVLGYSCPCLSDWSNNLPTPINPDIDGSETDFHYNSGGRRIVRINNTSIAICPVGSGERTYRSTNNGRSWTEVDSDGHYSGCLVSGPDYMVYHFYRQENNIYMVKFRYDKTPPPPVSIFSDVGDSNQGVYKMLNATVDKNGALYVVCHWGDPDMIYLLKSMDNGESWQGPYQVSENNSSGWTYPHIEVTSENLLVCVFVQWNLGGNKDMVCCTSSNHGETWKRFLMSHGEDTYNPALLTVGAKIFLVFAQTADNAHKGMVFNISFNKGNTWSGWKVAESTCGYGDPSPALGSDGTIYVALRSSKDTNVTKGTCGNRSRSKLILSQDMGQTWHTADRYYVAERTGTRNQARYQTWWNYGGPLEWIWMQNENGGENRPIYYDINTDISIWDETRQNKKMDLIYKEREQAKKLN